MRVNLSVTAENVDLHPAFHRYDAAGQGRWRSGQSGSGGLQPHFMGPPESASDNGRGLEPPLCKPRIVSGVSARLSLRLSDVGPERRRVARDCFVSYAGSWYSAPAELRALDVLIDAVPRRLGRGRGRCRQHTRRHQPGLLLAP